MSPIQIAGTIIGIIIIVGWWWLLITLVYNWCVIHARMKKRQAAYKRFMERDIVGSDEYMESRGFRRTTLWEHIKFSKFFRK